MPGTGIKSEAVCLTLYSNMTMLQLVSEVGSGTVEFWTVSFSMYSSFGRLSAHTSRVTTGVRSGILEFHLGAWDGH